MTTSSRLLPGTLLLLAATAPPSLASVHEQQPNDAGHNCAPRGQHVVRQDDRGFAITHRDAPSGNRIKSEPSHPAEVAIGAGHKFDRSIFMARSARATETSDARR